MLLKKVNFSDTDKAVWYIEMGLVTKIFMAKSEEERLLTDSTSHMQRMQKQCSQSDGLYDAGAPLPSKFVKMMIPEFSDRNNDDESKV